MGGCVSMGPRVDPEQVRREQERRQEDLEYQQRQLNDRFERLNEELQERLKEMPTKYTVSSDEEHKKEIDIYIIRGQAEKTQRVLNHVKEALQPDGDLDRIQDRFDKEETVREEAIQRVAELRAQLNKLDADVRPKYKEFLLHWLRHPIFNNSWIREQIGDFLAEVGICQHLYLCIQTL